MMIIIDTRRQKIVDLSSFEEVPDAIAVDLENRQVTIRQLYYEKGRPNVEHHSVRYFPAGLKILTKY